MDIGLDENFDIILDDRKDLPVVTGREEFEQRVAVRVSLYFHRVIGDINRENILALLKMEAERVAVDFEKIDSIAQFGAEFDPEQAGRVNLTIMYQTGDEFSFSITE